METKLIKRGLLTAPYIYWDMPESDKRNNCNGCGPKGGFFLKVLSAIIPDSLLGVNITEACNIHDISLCVMQKREADDLFYKNMLAIVDARGGALRGARRVLARQYYNAVRAWRHDQ